MARKNQKRIYLSDFAFNQFSLWRDSKGYATNPKAMDYMILGFFENQKIIEQQKRKIEMLERKMRLIS